MAIGECYNRLTLRLYREGHVPLQKLEEILHAEDSARDAVAQARVEAARIAHDAAMEAEEIRRAAKRHATEEAQAFRQSALAAAAVDAAHIESEAAVTREVALAGARIAVPDAVAGILQELTG